MKNSAAVTAFQASFTDRLEAVVPVAQGQPVHVWAYDESRFELHTIRRRRTTARGCKPVCRCSRASRASGGAIAPGNGDAYFLGILRLHTDYMQTFLDEFAKARPHTLNVLLLDNSRGRTAFDNARRRVVYSGAMLAPWCSGLTCHPVTVEIVGSNPIGVASGDG